MNPDIEKLRQEREANEQKLAQYHYQEQRPKNRIR